jgi:drug/metabolite transporter (DMT)-like permease
VGAAGCSLHWVAGDLYVLLATAAWAYYSWKLAHPTPESASLRVDWAAFLLGQVVFGLGWSLLFAAAEWTLTDARLQWSWPLMAALLFIAVGPAVLAYRAWGAGVAQAGPAVAGFFINLTPLFTAMLSLAFLGEAPRLFHAIGLCIDRVRDRFVVPPIAQTRTKTGHTVSAWFHVTIEFDASITLV